MVILSFSLILFLQTIEGVNFTGNKTFSSGELMKLVSVRKGSTFSRSILDHDRRVLIDFYRKQGFFNTNIVATCIGDTVIQVRFEITEGVRPEIYRIYYPPDSEVVYHHSRVRSGDFLIEENLLSDMARVEDFLADHGYPFARITYYTVFENDTLLLFWNLERGNRYYIRRIIITGLKKVPRRIVEPRLLIRPGDLFSQSRIADTQRNLYLLFIFNMVEFEYELADSESLDILIKLEEGSPYGLNLGIGLMTPNRFVTSIEFEDLNIINSGNQLLIPILGWINLRLEYSLRIAIVSKLLYPFHLPFSITFGPFLERERRSLYERYGYGIEGAVRRQFRSDVEATISYQYRKLRYENVPITEGITNSITLKAIFDLRDQILDPKRGFFLLPSISYGGGVLGGDNNFIRYTLDSRIYLPLPGFIYAWRFQIGEIFDRPGGYKIHEEFQIASSSSLRGYREYEVGPDSIGPDHYGSFRFGIQSEPRFRFGKFGLVFFLDLGALERNHQELEFDDVEIGGGLGVRYFTPLGPIRLDWGKRLKSAPSRDYGHIYISLQHAF
ncbi:MAG TPA: hypothetical protein EYP24_02210 [bacterium (Candidatus Stahlbacteria)]|nr:hypothetical protein [Candidatus Stahlbacteria bacterium]